MKLIYFLLAVTITASCSTKAQDTKPIDDKDAAYTRTITERAEKIVNKLSIDDAEKALQVRTIIANQYRNLNNIHSRRDTEITQIKKAVTDNKELLASKIKEVEADATKDLEKLHKKYIAELSKNLTQEQVIGVKDGMTYGVVPITYKGYLDMLPNLTDEQKAKIYAWLVEAREHAMDAESSEKKHGWFGKYKGRINNYLSAEGYDLKKAGDEWQQRLKASKKVDTN